MVASKQAFENSLKLIENALSLTKTFQVQNLFSEKQIAKVSFYYIYFFTQYSIN